MRSSNFKILAGTVVLLIASRAHAQNSEPPAYLNPALPAEQRAADLVHRMTVEEKVTQLTNQSRAIDRLHIPAYNWWSETLHGLVQRPNCTNRLEAEGFAYQRTHVRCLRVRPGQRSGAVPSETGSDHLQVIAEEVSRVAEFASGRIWAR